MNSARDPRSGGERLDAERRGRMGERLILRRERQYLSERTPRQVRVDADVEVAENPQELDGQTARWRSTFTMPQLLPRDDEVIR